MTSLNEEKLAVEDIINRPEVTETTESHQDAPTELTNAPDAPKAAYDAHMIEQDAEILNKSICRLAEKTNLEETQAQAIAELSGELFKSVENLSLPRWARIGVLGTCVLLPCIPSIYALFTPKPLEDENDHDRQLTL